MKFAVHLAILRSASLLVPREQSVEWLAEWRAELWYVRQARCGKPEATAFCLGSYKDAFWLRRNSPCGEERIPRLASPAHCLLLLAALAVLSLLLVLILPDARNAVLVESRMHHPVGNLLWIIGFACLIVKVTNPLSLGLSLGEYPAGRHSPPVAIRLRRWLFLAAKIAMLLAIVYCGAFILGSFRERAVGAAAILIQLLIWGSILAFHWILRDQRRRCPVCLRLLANPVRVGRPSGYFLEWNCTELVCLRGHGLLYVPESRTSWFNAQRWFYLEP